MSTKMPRNYNKMADEAIKLAGGRMPMPVSKATAEKLFNRKADPDSYLTPKAFLKKKAKGFVMSKGVGKVLDSKVGKAGVKVGNAVIKAAKWPGKQIEKEMRMNKKKDDLYRKQGKELNRQYSGRK